MEIHDILAELRQNRGYFPQPAVDEAIRQREEITPHLLRALEEVSRNGAPTDDEVSLSFLPIYALFLLAQFREHRAYPLIMKLCELPSETLVSLLGDTITEGLPRIIASVFDGNLVPLKAVIEKPANNEYARSAALGALSFLVHTGAITRTDTIAYFTELFRGTLEREPSNVWDTLASKAVDLYATSLAGDIHAAYEAGLVNPGYMQPSEVDHEFSLAEETVLANSWERGHSLIDDVGDEMHWWYCFNPILKKSCSKHHDLRKTLTDSAPSNESVTPPVAPYVRAAPKVGRNDPCPCGSGKKHKKCCGAL